MTPSIESRKAVVVSDVHLGYERCDHEAFLNFIATYSWDDVDHLILLGDTFDFWRRQNARVLVENEEIIRRILSLHPQVMFVRGNHDYYLEDAAERFYKIVDVPSRRFGIGRTLLMRSGEHDFMLMHGYELEVLSSSWLEPLGLDAYEGFCKYMCMSEDKSGTVADWLWNVVSGIPSLAKEAKRALKKLLDPTEERELEFIDEVAKSTAKNILLGLPKDAVLVFGHTHRAFDSDDVVNSGSWVIDPGKEAHTYVEIIDGSFKRKDFPQTKERVELAALEMKRVAKVVKRRASQHRHSAGSRS